MKNIYNMVKTVLKKLENGKLAIFFGTGLSFNSGNLTADSIRYVFLDALAQRVNSITQEDLLEKITIDLVINRTTQLEDFLMRIVDDFPVAHEEKNFLITKLLNIIYKGKNPNVNHYLLAWLLKKKIVRYIYTTNFDEHLEKAYDELFGMNKFSENVERKIFDGSFIDKSKKLEQHYYKLHGCLSKKIGTLLPRVASKDNIENIKGDINYLFSNGEHETVLVMGYSFSDAYDIGKIIKDIAKGFKEVWIILHKNCMEDKCRLYNRIDVNATLKLYHIPVKK